MACTRCWLDALSCHGCLLLQVGRDLISLITSREGVDELLKLDDVIDLVIPRGSNALVSHIQRNTRIAVLGHADGICHIYVDPDSSVDMACRIIVDAKLDYPAACNAVEKVLVHSALARDGRVSGLQHHRGPGSAEASCLSYHACQLLLVCASSVLVFAVFGVHHGTSVEENSQDRWIIRLASCRATPAHVKLCLFACSLSNSVCTLPTACQAGLCTLLKAWSAGELRCLPLIPGVLLAGRTQLDT